MTAEVPDLRVPVLIVGAGPAGLIMALSLAQNGIKPRIIDKDSEFHAGSRGFGVQPRSYELFQSLGILPDVQELATEIPTMRAYEMPGGIKEIKTWDLYEKTNPEPDRPFGNGTCLSQSVLEEIIRKHLKKLDIVVELSTELIGIDQISNGVKCILRKNRLSTSENKETLTVTAEYLVGSDGAKGNTRKLLDLSFKGQTRDTDGMVWADVQIANLSTDFWHIWGIPGQFTIMARPLKPNAGPANPNGSVFGVGVTGHNFDPTALDEPDKFKHFIESTLKATGIELGEVSWLSYFKPNMRMVNKFHKGRAFVVGDSAHVHSPTGGQGMNCSVQDSSNLAWKLALVIKKLAPPSLLSSYNDERLPVITQMLHATSALYTHTVAKVKSTATRETTEDPKATGWLRWRNDALHMFGINYRFSDIVVDERRLEPLDAEDARAHAYNGYGGTGALQAGDRAPEIPSLVMNGSETSLFALLKSSLHTVLIFAVEGKEKIVEKIYSYITCSAFPVDVIQTFVLTAIEPASLGGSIACLVDLKGCGRTNYLVGDGEVDVVIIRPDTFIGAIVKDECGIRRYFSKIFEFSKLGVVEIGR